MKNILNKIYDNAAKALDGVLFDGMTIMAGGFGLCGIPENLIAVIRDSGVKNLTVISNNCGVDDFGIGLWLKNHQMKKLIASYVGENETVEHKLQTSDFELQVVPQGTLAEAIRAGGAGVPAFFTKTGVGTIVDQGKETRDFDGVTYLMEKALRADLAIIKGHKADQYGNVVYNKTARNFNPIMATAADLVVCEVEEIVDKPLDPDYIHTPGIYIHRLIRGVNYAKRIEGQQ